MGLWSYLFGGKPAYKPVGYCEFNTEYTRSSGTPTKISHVAILHMTDDGKRKLTFLSSPMFDAVENEYILTNHPFRLKLDLWVKGGPFPKSFNPFGDTLGEMLVRLVDMKLENADAAAD